MATSKKRPVLAWLAASLLAAPAFAQTHIAVAPVEGFSAPVAPAVGAGAAGMGAAAVVSPVSFSAAALNGATSAPSAPAPRAAERGAVLSGPAASAATPAMASPARRSAAAAAVAPVFASLAPARSAAPAHASASAVASPEAASAPIFSIRPDGAREAAAVATVERGVSDWTARSAQTLDAAPVPAAASEGTAPLERPSARDNADRPAPPAPSKLRTVMGWAWPIVAGAAAITSIDFGTKLFAAKHLFTVFHEVAWRTPFLMAIIPYVLFTAYKSRVALPYDHSAWHWNVKKLGNGRLGFFKDEISGMPAMIKDHPSMKWAVRLYDASIALMVGGMLGNGIDALRLGGALDWIPLGRSLMNFADIAVLLGLSLFQLGSSFMIKAGMAHKSGKPLHFSTVNFLGLPLAGVFIAWALGSAAGGGALDLTMKNIGFLYLMAFSMLVGFGRFLAASVWNQFVKRFVAEEATRTKPAGPAAAR